MDHKLTVRAVCFVITERCTLHCRLCAGFSSHYQVPPHGKLEDIENAIDAFFRIVDRVEDLSISGGEPLLHKDVYRVLRYLLPYADRIDRVLLLTNGTIVPDESELRQIKELPGLGEKLRFHISDYGPALSRKVHEVTDVLKKTGIDHRIISYWGSDLFCNGWVDFGDNTQKYFTEDDIRTHASQCEFRKRVYLSVRTADGDAWLTRCARAFWRKHLGILPEGTDDVIRLPYDGAEAEAVRKRVLKMIHSEYSDSCAFCNGMREDSVRFPPAEQFQERGIKNE